MALKQSILHGWEKGLEKLAKNVSKFDMLQHSHTVCSLLV